MEARYCEQGSGWACNEIGVLAFDRPDTRDAATSMFRQSCDRGFQTGCTNVTAALHGDAPQRAGPALADWPVVLRSGKGALPGMPASELYTLACEQGWRNTCQLAARSSTSRNPT
jgi:hypothetical protein